MKRTLLLALLGFNAASLLAQKELVQLSGIVLTSDSLKVVPYAGVRILGTTRGTMTDFDGFFSLAVHKADTILFTCVGYKPRPYVIPADLDRTKYSVIQLLTRDTIHLDETVIYPWPTPGEFKDAFVALNIPDDDMERARKNLDRERLKEISLAMSADANEAQDYYARNQSYQLYYYGQSPPIQILNPFAWAEFFKAWKRGDFRKS